jgi:hypothetical protein
MPAVSGSAVRVVRRAWRGHHMKRKGRTRHPDCRIQRTRPGPGREPEQINNLCFVVDTRAATSATTGGRAGCRRMSGFESPDPTPDVRIRRSARRTVLARQARTMFNQQIKILDQGLRGAASATPPDMRGPGGGGGVRAHAGPAARRGASLKPASGLFGWGQAPTTLLVLCGRVAQSEVVGRAASYQRDGRAAGYACVRTTWRAIPLVSRKPGGCLSRPHAAVWSGKGIQLDCSACNCQPTSSGTAPPLPSQAPQEGCSGLQWAAVGCKCWLQGAAGGCRGEGGGGAATGGS